MINFLQTLIFSDEEIKEVEKTFFPPGVAFNLEQRNVIGCFSKQNIQACPGSGKTTTLAAKLLLLRKKLPKSIKGGICILTHTNVAVDIIKQRLGHENAAFYNNYPNYLGTIQSFINKYLAAPAYRDIYKKPLQAIDDEIFYSIIGKRQNQASTAVNFFSRSHGIDNLGHLSFNIHNFDISKLNTGTDPIVGKHTTSYLQLERLKKQILNEGFLKYDEAYSLAYLHLRNHPSLKNLFFKRFPLVFLDEMQDTEAIQFNLLNDLFGNHSIFQTIGDVNQDIYGNYDDIIQQFPASLNFSMTTCSRFPHHIAEFIQKVGVETHNIQGGASQNPIFPHIIVYDDGSIHKVKDKFGEIIINNGLHTINNAVFKAVGSRKNNGKINIVSYFSDFNKQDQKVKEHYPALMDYTNKLLSIKSIAGNIKALKGIIVSIFIEALRLNTLKNETTGRLFTAQSLENYLKYSDLEFYKYYRLAISKWIKRVLEGVDISQDIKDFLLNSLLVQFSSTPNDELSIFINSSATIQDIAQQEKQNIYQASSGDQTVKISFDTVHGVKGETHTGTLFMETFNQCFDLQKILPLLSGAQNRTTSFINTNKRRMKMAYVAMSRPTHLLCLAVHKDRINLNDNWAKQGVTIVEV